MTLFGVEIIPRRRAQLARFDRPLARELFVRHALVEGEWDPSGLDKRLTAFERRNLELRRRLEKIEERERRRDILVGDEAVYAFYDARIPRDVFDVRSFEAWWRDAANRTPRLLDMTEADLLDDAARADERAFPARWRQADQVLSLTYRFEPGAEDDGVTAIVPLALLAQVRPDGFDWQVPGMRDEMITALLRALPKAIRRHVVPAADWAARFAEDLEGMGPEAHEGMPPTTLRDALAARIQRVANQPVTAADFELDRVPAHLQVSFRVVDERGRAVGSGRDLAELQRRFSRSRPHLRREVAEPDAGRARSSTPQTPDSLRRRAPPPRRPASASTPRAGLTDWDFGDLPEVVDTQGRRRGGPRLSGARRRGLQRRAARGGDARGRRARHARGRAPAPAAGGAVARVVRARAPHLCREARTRGIPVPVGEGARRRRAPRGGGCRARAHRAGSRSCARAPSSSVCATLCRPRSSTRPSRPCRSPPAS